MTDLTTISDTDLAVLATDPKDVRAELARRVEAEEAATAQAEKLAVETTEASAAASARLQVRMDALNVTIEAFCDELEETYKASEAAKAARALAVKHGGTPTVLNNGRAWMARMGPGGTVTPENAHLFERLAKAVTMVGRL